MSAPAIDFAALLAEAREEARVRREKQLQEQHQQLRQLQLCQHQRRQQQHRQQQHQYREEEKQQQQHCMEGKEQQEREEEQQAQLREASREEETDAKESEQFNMHSGLLQETSRAEGEDGYPCVLNRIHLRAVDVQHVYNELQQDTVGVGKRFLLVDLQSAVAFASRHVCQAVSGQQLLREGQRLQQLRQRPPQELLVYGASHEDDKCFQHLMQAGRAIATTANTQALNTDVFNPASFEDTAAVSLLRQLLQVVLPKVPARKASLQQQTQQLQHGKGQFSDGLEDRLITRIDGVGSSTAQEEEIKVGVAWLRGGLEAFAAAFPFLCVSSHTEKEATSALTAKNTVAYLSYPVLVYSANCGSREFPRAAQWTTSRGAVSAAGSKTDALANHATDSNSPLCSTCTTPKEQARRCALLSLDVTPALAGVGTAAPQPPDIPVGVHGLYVGTKLHAMSPAIRRRLRIGTIIDLTPAGLPAQLEKSKTRWSRASSSAYLSSKKIIHRESPNHGDGGPTGCDRGEEEENEVVEQVIRPLTSADTCAAARRFFGYESNSDDQPSSAARYPWWLEGMPQRQREIATAMGNYVLPLDACVELLKSRFGPSKRGEGLREASRKFPAETQEETDFSFSASGSRKMEEVGNMKDMITSGGIPYDHVRRRNTLTKSDQVKSPGASIDMRASESSGSASTAFPRKSMLIVHSGDSEKWSGSAAATIVAAFLFSQQKCLPLFLPHQEVRVAMALLTARWRLAPALEDFHRQQLQRFCERERHTRINDKRTASAVGGVDSKVKKATKESSVATNGEVAKLQPFPYRPLSANMSPDTEAPAIISERARLRHSVHNSNCAGGGRVGKEQRDDCTRARRQEADEAYLTATTALHTATLCGLPGAPVFIVPEDEDNCASAFRHDAVKEKEGEGGAEAEAEVELEKDQSNYQWPRHLLTNLGRITQQIKVTTAASTAGDDPHGKETYCGAFGSAYRATKDSFESEGGSGHPAVGVDQTVGASGSRRGTSGLDGTAKKGTVGETSAGNAGGEESEGPGHKHGSPACSQFIHRPLGDGLKEVYELGALRLFANLCRDEIGERRDIVALANMPARAHVVKADAAAASKAKRIAASRLYQLATNGQRCCTKGAGEERAHTGPREHINVCEMWELAANTMGCMIRSWLPLPADKAVSDLCKALCALLELLASACRRTLWKISSSTETRMNIVSRVTTAWGALLLNVSFLWVHIARLLYRCSARSSGSYSEPGTLVETDSPPHQVSHVVLGGTLLSILLQTILRLVERLLQAQLAATDGALSEPRDQRVLLGAGASLDQAVWTARSVPVFPRAHSSHLTTERTHLTPNRLPSQSTEGQEEYFFGYPTVALRLLLCALHGTFLRPQIVPKLEKRLLKAVPVPADRTQPPKDFALDISTTANTLKSPLAWCTPDAPHAEAAAAAAVSSARRILRSDGVQSILHLAEVWAAIYPVDLQKLLGEIVRKQEVDTPQHERTRHAHENSGETGLPVSLGVALRPFVFMSEEYTEPCR